MLSPRSDVILQVGSVLLWLALVGGCSEGARRLGGNAELTRKIVHIGAGQVILLAWWLSIPAWMGITASVLFAGIALLSYRLPILPGINSVGRKSFGTCFYAVSFGLIMAAFWPIHQPYYGVIGILTMSWGDGLAALIGQRFGRHSYQVLNQTKSWEGSLTMLLVSFMLTAGVLISIQGAIWQTWAVAGMVALVATSLETISQFGIDNLTVPLTAAMVAFGLNSLWQ